MAWGVPKLGTLVEDATGNFDLIEPAGVAQGDLMVACIAYRGNAAITAPTGWAAAAAAQNSGDTDATNGIASGAMFYIIRGASAPSLTCTRTGGDVVLARVISYSGAKPHPLDTGSSNTLAVASGTVTTGTITTAEAGELLVAMGSGGDAYTTSAFDAATNPATASGATDTTTAPTNDTWIERQDSNTGTGADATLAIADAIKATAGATGTIECTMSGSARSVMMVAAFKLKNISPTVSLNSPTDASSSADTTPTLDFTGTDTEADSIEYQVQIDTVSTFDSAAGVVIDDSFTTTPDNNDNLYSVQPRVGQSFISGGGTLEQAVFQLVKFSGSPTGNAVATLYAATGLFGTAQNLPTGSALATSDNFDVSTLTGSLQDITFTFTGANRYAMVAGTNYFIAVEYSGGDGSNFLRVGGVLTNTPQHPGIGVVYNGSTWGQNNRFKDVYFIVKIDAPLLNKVSETDAGFVNPDTGGDTHPFNSGENIQYTVQAGDALANGTYYWRVKGLDPAGSNIYGSWSSTRSFTIDTGGAVVKDILSMGILPFSRS